jgi:hypothetical protein
MTGEEDSDREIRAMILLTLPYPPLPVLAARIEDGHIASDGVTTSHTLLAKALSETAWRNDPAANTARMARQKRVFQEFLHAMATGGFATDDPERLYLLYCRFSLDHLATYLPLGHPIDIRFQPYAYTTKGDATHRKLAEYMAAQSIFFEDPVPITREQYVQRYDLRDMLFTLRDRLGHVSPDPACTEEAH